MEFVDYNNKKVSILSEFPIGYVLITTTNTNPGNFTAGTWEAFGTGRTLVGIDADQTEFNTVLKTGGEKTHTLSSSEMPSHTHTQGSHSHTGTASSAGSHSHTITANSGGSHNHYASSNWTGTHGHDILVYGYGRTASLNSGNDESYLLNYSGGGNSGNYASGRLYAKNTGSHNHTITVDYGGSHTHTGSSNSTGAHTHTLSTNSATPTINSTGGSAAHNNLQPYITVYMWKRTK